LNIFHHFIYY